MQLSWIMLGIKITGFGDVTQRNFINGYKCFGGTSRVYFLFYTEDGGNRIIWNNGTHLPNYTGVTSQITVILILTAVKISNLSTNHLSFIYEIEY
jgi:hypothetical protein